MLNCPNRNAVILTKYFHVSSTIRQSLLYTFEYRDRGFENREGNILCRESLDNGGPNMVSSLHQRCHSPLMLRN